MVDNINCEQCRFVQHDPSADEGKWRAYECGNHKSVYYKALLNITKSGKELSNITWIGCELGESVERGGV
jgi:hypothetical protein